MQTCRNCKEHFTLCNHVIYQFSSFLILLSKLLIVKKNFLLLTKLYLKELSRIYFIRRSFLMEVMSMKLRNNSFYFIYAVERCKCIFL